MKKDLSTNHLIAIYMCLLALIILTLFINTWFYFQYNFRIIDSQIKQNVTDLYKISQILENNYSNKMLSFAELKKNDSIYFTTDKQFNLFFLIDNYQIEIQNNNDIIKINLDLKATSSIVIPYLIITIIYTVFFLTGSFMFLKNQKLKTDYQNLLTNSFKLSQKLAHDIRSPLSTLNLISSKLTDLELKDLQQAVVQQINIIAQEHLDHSKSIKIDQPIHKAISPVNIQKNDSLLSLFFQRLEQEYEFKRFSIPQAFKIDIDYSVLKERSVSQELENLIYRSINNFIQNSVEATPTNGKITLTVSSSNMPDYNLIISVIDNGKGIPGHIMKRLGKEKISFGKDIVANDISSGNGIAILNAAQDLKSLGAKLEIDSQENIGTTIRVYI